jgi:glyoxylase-like metal-dependent hydrolase (beta-lactamase superfamily II)
MPQVFNLGDQRPSLKGVHMISGDGLCSNIFVVGEKHATIIDTGVGNWANPVWPQLESIGIKPENVDKIVISHAHHDHASGLFLLLEKVKVSVYVQTKDTKYLAKYLGDALVKSEEGQVIETELWPLEVIWTPGHTEGGMCLYAREQRILFSGDTAFGDGYFGNFGGDSGSLSKLIQSLRKLAALHVDVMLPGHGPPVYEDAEGNLKLALHTAENWA